MGDFGSWPTAFRRSPAGLRQRIVESIEVYNADEVRFDCSECKLLAVVASNRSPTGGVFAMPNVQLTKLRKDFDTAITSNRNEVTLDPSIAELRMNVSQTDFVESCSIYSRSQLRKINDWLGRISNARLKADPMEVAIAVGAVRQLLDDLEITMRQSVESKRRIEAAKHA